jgi:hypothetical protein
MKALEFEKRMQVGLGEAIKRTNRLHTKVSSGIASKEELAEHELLMEALNEIKIDLGFDCDEDGIPDTIEVFARTAKTSCCRLVPSDGMPKKKKRRSSSRKGRE